MTRFDWSREGCKTYTRTIQILLYNQIHKKPTMRVLTLHLLVLQKLFCNIVSLEFSGRTICVLRCNMHNFLYLMEPLEFLSISPYCRLQEVFSQPLIKVGSSRRRRYQEWASHCFLTWSNGSLHNDSGLTTDWCGFCPLHVVQKWRTSSQRQAIHFQQFRDSSKNRDCLQSVLWGRCHSPELGSVTGTTTF